MNEEDEDFYTGLELDHAIDSLTDEDYVALRNFARFNLVFADSTLTETDLLAEAVLRSLDGTRRWNRNLNIRQHLIGVMRSIASDSRRSAESRSESVEYKEELDGHGFENDVVAQEIVRQLFGQFAKDPEVTLVLSDLLEEKSRKESIEDSGLSENEYNAARKRLVRELVQRRKRGEV